LVIVVYEILYFNHLVYIVANNCQKNIVANGWLMNNLNFAFLSLPWYLSFVWSKLELSFEAIGVH
jgi:hypothetical protein